MSTVRILLEVASTDERTPQELADIAAGRLTSCLGVDQRVQEPVKGSVMPEWGVAGVYDNEKQSRLNKEWIGRLIDQDQYNQAAPRSSYDDLRNANQQPAIGHPLWTPEVPCKRTFWDKLWGWM